MVERRGKVKGVPTRATVKYTYVDHNVSCGDDEVTISMSNNDTHRLVRVCFSLGKNKAWELLDNEIEPNEDDELTSSERRKLRITKNRQEKKKQNELKRNKVKTASDSSEEESDDRSDTPCTYAEVVQYGEEHRGKHTQPLAEHRKRKVLIDDDYLNNIPAYREYRDQGYIATKIEITVHPERKQLVNKAGKFTGDNRISNIYYDNERQKHKKKVSIKDWKADFNSPLM